MKTLKIFGWLSHFLWASMLLLTIFFGILVYSEFTSTYSESWFIEFMGKEIQNDSKKTYLLTFMLICFCIYSLYFYAITLFNLCVRKFEKRIFFDHSIIKRFRKIGIIFISNYIAVLILGKVFSIHSGKEITSSTDFSTIVLEKLDSPLGSLIIGFFFLVLSQVFKEALKQKQENELTI
ncbi:DUF2975 domain-containing protein [Flavobacterium sp. I3-2]|uniref:DUF2975 domain-containing protein n=1 Tax=Flavobacterium sp. I3-2 TaxID=2748319 RepID=UPI0015AA791B|nr:DUF2975 domain-containing protein [Flavobacterium sp. I3-2]